MTWRIRHKSLDAASRISSRQTPCARSLFWPPPRAGGPCCERSSLANAIVWFAIARGWPQRFAGPLMVRPDIQEALRKAAAQLSEEMRSRPFVSRALGSLLLRRLASDDWIKSPLLTSFLRPVTPPRLWRPNEEDMRHVISKQRELQPGATALDALEDLLSRFDKRAVGGAKRWFEDLAGLRGYWFDKRMQTLSLEMLSVAGAMDWAEVTRLERDPARKTPDLIARAQGLIVVADAKALLGRYWPVKIVQTMLRALQENFGQETVGRIIVVLSNMDVQPELLEREVDQLTVDSLAAAVEVVATIGGSFGLTDNLVVERATPTDLLYGQRAFPAHLPDTNEEWRALFDSLSSGIEGIRQACLKAWAQCEAYDVQESASERRLDVAFVAGEYFLLHEDLAPTQSQVRDWLQSEVWPAHPRRAVVLVSTEMLQPVWLINPLL